MLVPSAEICVCTAAVVALPSVTIVTTAPTPMTMPSIVSTDRSRCPTIADHPVRRVSNQLMRSPGRH